MDQMRNDDDMPNRASNMEQADGSRDQMRNSGSDSESSGGRGDLGTSSDRAMFDERMSNTRSTSERGISSRERNRDSSSDGSSSEDSSFDGSGSSSSERGSSNAGGITNRELDREQCEQDRLPRRGESQSER